MMRGANDVPREVGFINDLIFKESINECRGGFPSK